MVTAGVSKTPGGNSLPVRVRPRADLTLAQTLPQTAGQTLEPARVRDKQLVLRHEVDQPLGSKPGQRAADRLDRQPEIIGDIAARHRQGESLPRVAAWHDLAALQQQERGEPLARRLAPQ